LRAVQDLIVDAASSYQEEMADFTRELVSIPTENPPGAAYQECVSAIEQRLHALGLEYTVLEVPTPDREVSSYPRYCLLGFHGSGDRTLYFHGHYDVVPASSKDQFQPSLRNGNLFGRGSSDMKSGLAAMTYALAAIRDCQIPLDGRIGLCLVPDEETGGAGGSQFLADAGLLGKDGIGMLTAEPTSGAIWNANRGALTLRITIKGKSAHVGLQYRGINAFEHMIVVAGALQRLKEEVEQRTTGSRLEPEAARRSILMLGGRCEGGTSFNLVPDECWFTVERRINPEEDLQVEKARIMDLLEGLRHEGIDLQVEILQEAVSASSSEDGELARALAGSIEAVTGKPPTFEMCPGLLEIRFYDQQGIPAYAYGPGLLSVSHGPNEFVKVKDISACAAIYALTAARLLSPR
jgi:acetylornithine deacetylase/succinyl-diaminopimelate desuccinylase family protein